MIVTTVSTYIEKWDTPDSMADKSDEEVLSVIRSIEFYDQTAEPLGGYAFDLQERKILKKEDD